MTTICRVPLFDVPIGQDFTLNGEDFTLVMLLDGQARIERGGEASIVPSGLMVEVDR